MTVCADEVQAKKDWPKQLMASWVEALKKYFNQPTKGESVLLTKYLNFIAVFSQYHA